PEPLPRSSHIPYTTLFRSVLVKRRLNELSLAFTSEEFEATTERLIQDALEVSGDIVLRAAKRGISAGELIGLVLSHYILSEELQDRKSTRLNSSHVKSSYA